MGEQIPQAIATFGPFKPMRFEATIEDCTVLEGEIPKDLNGGFYRVGPTFKRNNKQGNTALLAMDGMVQGLVFENGRADFRNRWVRTPKYQLEDKHGKGMFEWSDGCWSDFRFTGGGNVKRDEFTSGVPQGSSNINIFPFGGEMLASGEQGCPPVAIDPIMLETKGLVNWKDKLSGGIYDEDYASAFTAHPKWDDATGILYGWAYSDKQPHITVYEVHPDGSVVSRPITDVPYNAHVHDMWLTDQWLVLPIQPFIVSQERIAAGKVLHDWDPTLPIMLALVPRNDIVNGPVRWIETGFEPQYIMHTLGANVTDGVLTLDGPIFNRPPFPLDADFSEGDDVALYFSVAKSTMGRWTVDLNSGASKSEFTDDRPGELPKIDERFYGKNYNWGCYLSGEIKREGMRMTTLTVRNSQTGTNQEYQLRHKGDAPSLVMEPTFVPRTPDSPEGDGYILVPISRWLENVGEYAIFDSYDISKGPVCRVEIPFRMGFTPHGHWMDFR